MTMSRWVHVEDIRWCDRQPPLRNYPRLWWHFFESTPTGDLFAKKPTFYYVPKRTSRVSITTTKTMRLLVLSSPFKRRCAITNKMERYGLTVFSLRHQENYRIAPCSNIMEKQWNPPTARKDERPWGHIFQILSQHVRIVARYGVFVRQEQPTQPRAS